MNTHSIHATVLACLADSHLPPIYQNTAIFYGGHKVDDQYGGLAFEEEGTRCARLLSDPQIKVQVMGNHGVLIIGDGVAETYIRALQTGQPLHFLSSEVAEKKA
jgi:ribulose-5-phosphate 4-epimerase/fuculose-1-phosphate aldolase